ncbi:hypothetical protein [Rhodococcus sp. 14-2496-1d]|uniref:hypothetical protein n=1 Tax=Rhodococcus sp. 14-2496-1d TaxID=2023146 RepID=UPI00117BB3E8|nr:hypothetical protein [Rhodococcus sp. 14-2496-1d]
MSATKTFARDLCASDLGSTAWFDWTFPQSNVKARVSGEIRKIVHEGGITILSLKGESAGASSDFTLVSDTTVDLAVS